MSLPKLNKLYFPGLISLVFLPMMCIGYFCTNFFFKTYGLKVNWVDDSIIKSWASFENPHFNINSFRKFKINILTGDERKDNQVLNNFEKDVKNLECSNDTTRGYCLSFSNTTYYEEIVKSIDICAKYQRDNTFYKNEVCYILYKNRILVWKGDAYKIPMPPPILIL